MTLSSLQALPDRELVTRVARDVMGWTVEEMIVALYFSRPDTPWRLIWWSGANTEPQRTDVFDPLNRISDAWMVEAEMWDKHKMRLHLHRNEDGTFSVAFYAPGVTYDALAWVTVPSAPRAIVLAALMAVENR